LLINPFAIEELSGAIHEALSMPREECARRMRRMRGVVAENNVYRWAGKIISTLLRIESDDVSGPAPLAFSALPFSTGVPDAQPPAAARGA
jgi:trehalose 6-phosphate synthase